MGNLRGAFNASDLNRMEQWLDKIKEDISGLGLGKDLKPGKKWDSKGSPVLLGDINAIRNKIVSLRDILDLQEGWREIKFDPTITLEQANSMEWDIEKLYNRAVLLSGMYIYSGESFAGEA